MQRLVAGLLLGIGLLLAPGFTPPANAAVSTTEAEAQFVAKINALRAAKGLKPYRVHPELVALARSWATKMAGDDRISHNPNLAHAVAADWQKLGENVGVGSSVDKLHDAFVASPAHYRNLVDPDFTYIGVGVVIGRDGAIFTAHEFMQLANGAPEPPPEETTTTSTEPPPPVPTTTTSAPVRPGATSAVDPSYRLGLVLSGLHRFDSE